MTRQILIPLSALLFLLAAVPAAARPAVRPTPVAECRGEGDLHDDARTLEHQTLNLLKRARHSLDRPDRAERKAMNRLAILHREAREFHEATEQNRRLRPMIADYRELVRAFEGAKDRFVSLDPDRALRKQIRRVRASVAGIEDRFEPVVARIDRRGRGHERARSHHTKRDTDWRWGVAWNRR